MEAALDNWQPVWNAQVSISTPVCVNLTILYDGLFIGYLHVVSLGDFRPVTINDFFIEQQFVQVDFEAVHYDDVIMGQIASQITSLTIVYSIVYSSTDQRKHQSSVSLAFVRGIHRGPVNSPHKGPVTRKMFPFDDVIMWYLGHSLFLREFKAVPQFCYSAWCKWVLLDFVDSSVRENFIWIVHDLALCVMSFHDLTNCVAILSCIQNLSIFINVCIPV